MRKISRFMLVTVVIVSLFLVSSFVLGESSETSISILFNSINISVNGEAVESNNILYEGTTYVPLRDVAEMLGKEVSWDEETRIAGINDEITEAVTDKPSEEVVVKENEGDFNNVIATLEANTVNEKIKENAEDDWPSDYQMQSFQIKNQTEAYNDLLALTLDTEVKEKILNEAYTDWKFDFKMVLFSFNNALEDYDEIESLNLDTDKKKEILQNAQDKWGTDYGMVLYEYKNQLESYESLNE